MYFVACVLPLPLINNFILYVPIVNRDTNLHYIIIIIIHPNTYTNRQKHKHMNNDAKYSICDNRREALGTMTERTGTFLLIFFFF